MGITFKVKFSFSLLVLILLATSCQTGESANGHQEKVKEQAIAFMAKESDWIDISKAPYNADKTGKIDISEIFQKALNDVKIRTKKGKSFKKAKPPYKADPFEKGRINSIIQTIYFPVGTYRMDHGVSFGDNRWKCNFLKIVGQSREKTIIKLKDRTEGFGDSAKPVPIISFFDGMQSANAFFNSIRNLTIDAGQGNPGAIGLRFINNNSGHIRDLTLKSGADSGAIGLDMTTMLGGITNISDLSVDGFDVGIATAHIKICMSFENIRLRRQRKAGFINDQKCVAIRKLDYQGDAPAIINREQGGMVIVLDSALKAEKGGETAILNKAGFVLARNVRTSGWKNALVDQGQNLPDGFIEEYVTGGKLATQLSRAAKGLDLPVKETPQIPVDLPETWAVVDSSKQLDDTKAIQAAIDSGATTVFLPRDLYVISSPIHIRGKVKRLDCGYSRFIYNFPTDRCQPLFIVETSEQAAVVLERGYLGYHGSGKFYYVQNNSENTLVLKDLMTSGADGSYRNSGNGDLFLVNVVSSAAAGAGSMRPRPDWVFKNQKVWARHLNPESAYPHVTNDGGDLWVLGFKTGERHGPYFVTRNHGRTELLGGLFNALGGQYVEYDDEHACRPMIVNDNSQTSVTAIETTRIKGGVHRTFLLDLIDGDAELMTRRSMPKRFTDDQGKKPICVPLGIAGRQIHRKPSATVFIENSPKEVDEGDELTIRLARKGPVDQALPVNFALGWDNTIPDFNLDQINGEFAIPAGKSKAELKIKIENERKAYGQRLLHLLLAGSSKYSVDGDQEIKIVVNDDDVDLKHGLQASYEFKDSMAKDLSGKNRSVKLQNVETILKNGLSIAKLNGSKKQPALLNPDPETLFLRSRVYKQAVSLWFKADSLKGPHVIWQEGGAHSFVILRIINGKLQLMTRQTTHYNKEALISATTSDPILKNEWKHVVINIFRGKVALWLNGVKTMSIDTGYPRMFRPHFCPDPSTGLGNVYSACWTKGMGKKAEKIEVGSQPFKGMIADVRIWKRALSDKEIEKLGSTIYKEPVDSFKAMFQ